MQIEFHTPQGEIKEWIIDHFRDELIKLHGAYNEISRAQVYFREQKEDNNTDDKICEVDLTIYGNSIFVHRAASTYEQGMRDVLAELTEKVNEQIRNRQDPPDEITSSVDIQ